MNHRHDTTPTLAEERVRRLRELLAMMVDRYGDTGPMIAAIRRNLSRAEAAHLPSQDGQARR